MDQAAAIDASRPYDLINAANRATGSEIWSGHSACWCAATGAGARTGQELALSKSRAVAAAGGGGSDTSVINQEALIERQGAFYKALEMFGGLEEFNQLN